MGGAEQQVAQSMINFLAWFLMPFAIFLTVEWLVSLFRRD